MYVYIYIYTYIYIYILYIYYIYDDIHYKNIICMIIYINIF